ncbi:MAG: hypothetical protein IJ639_10950 [Ruminococcus sp.]|nr:hypothetical protein [Ruminococcus sp.]
MDMKKTNNKSAKRKLIPAIAMLTCSAVMLSTATYAWFTMNKTVSVTNMQVKATAEEGLLVNEVATYNSETWDEEATANQPTGVTAINLYPTSTKNGTAWVHANSKKSNNAAGATAANAKSENLTADGYTVLTLAADQKIGATEGSQAEINAYYVDGDGDNGYDAEERQYYAKYTYYLKSSSDTTLSLGTTAGSYNLGILPTATGTSGSEKLDKALRVGVAIGGKFYIFAPIDGATTSYFYNAGGTGAAAVTAYTTKQATDLASLPNTSTNGTQVDVYLWFEGEDENCMTDNITASLDTLSVNVQFSLDTLEADATVNGVSMS